MRKFQRQGKNTYVAAITLTFRNPTEFYMGVYNICKWILLVKKPYQDFILYPEYTKEGHLHFHGTIWYTNKLHFYTMLTQWRIHKGYIKVKHPASTKDILAWTIYCMKDQALHKRYRIHKYNIKQRFKQSVLKCFSNRYSSLRLD